MALRKKKQANIVLEINDIVSLYDMFSEIKLHVLFMRVINILNDIEEKKLSYMCESILPEHNLLSENISWFLIKSKHTMCILFIEGVNQHYVMDDWGTLSGNFQGIFKSVWTLGVSEEVVKLNQKTLCASKLSKRVWFVHFLKQLKESCFIHF